MTENHQKSDDVSRVSPMPMPEGHSFVRHDLLQRIVNYLQTKPYQEVASLIGEVIQTSRAAPPTAMTQEE